MPANDPYYILLDTHIALWLMLDDPKLPASVASKLKSKQYRWIFHQVSIWEIQIKYDLGKLPLPATPEKLIFPGISRSGMLMRDIQNEAIFMLGKLPAHHTDPFDRLLIAHALVNNWQIATVDSKFEKYPVKLLTE